MARIADAADESLAARISKSSLSDNQRTRFLNIVEKNRACTVLACLLPSSICEVPINKCHAQKKAED